MAPSSQLRHKWCLHIFATIFFKKGEEYSNEFPKNEKSSHEDFHCLPTMSVKDGNIHLWKQPFALHKRKACDGLESLPLEFIGSSHPKLNSLAMITGNCLSTSKNAYSRGERTSLDLEKESMFIVQECF
ncbi:hypothetical protein Tco_0679587 [Tanacetum coccineum]|uniref:Uncharacterized protein n=1 Tax=Tanacetum coccineum TaxID=301880 RepID=A0ABQ4XIA5_9ASTR